MFQLDVLSIMDEEIRLSEEIMDHPDEIHMLLEQMESIEQIKFSSFLKLKFIA